MLSDALVPRRARRELEETLQVLRIAVLNGPRQAGKTTLAKQLVAAAGGSFVTLDDPTTLQACLGDPRTFLTAYRKPLVVDEFQLGGDVLLRSVKSIVDEDLSRGQYLLTGSTRFLTVPSISESLAGRAGIVDLWPYTQGEIERYGEPGDGFLAQLLNPDVPVRQLADETPTRQAYLARICAGGFPEVQQLRSPAQRRRWFDAYIRTVTSRDVPGVSRVQHVAELPKLLGALAAMTGQQLVVARLAEKVALARQTVDRTYLPLLETVFMAVRLPAWSRNLLSRVTRHPRSYVADSGVAAHLLRVDERALADPMCAATGSLVETFVANELIRQESFGETRVQLSHYRTHDGVEVDVIAEMTDGRVGAVGIKASATVTLADFRHLARLLTCSMRPAGTSSEGLFSTPATRSCPSVIGWSRCRSLACGYRPNEPTRGEPMRRPTNSRGAAAGAPRAAQEVPRVRRPGTAELAVIPVEARLPKVAGHGFWIFDGSLVKVETLGAELSLRDADDVELYVRHIVGTPFDDSAGDESCSAC